MVGFLHLFSIKTKEHWNDLLDICLVTPALVAISVNVYYGHLAKCLRFQLLMIHCWLLHCPQWAVMTSIRYPWKPHDIIYKRVESPSFISVESMN